ncbi:MAG: MFS transporter, partial [Burkholderiales bacterium]
MLRSMPVRFRILTVLIVLSFVNYLLRNNFSAVIPSIRQEFGFSGEEIGWILGSFNISYTLCQIPGGVFGELIGSRRALAIIAVTWGLLTFMTGFAPALMAASATGAMISLIAVRFLMGIANAPIFPTMTGVVARWFPAGGWALPNSLSSMGLTLGQAAIGPVVTLLIIWFGWRESFYVLAPLGFFVGAWWYWYGRDRPAEHPAITRSEVELIDRDRDPAFTVAGHDGSWREVLGRRDVLLLAASYFCMNVVFYMFSQWLFTYLVEERGFTLLESGFLYVLPFATGAALSVAGGLVCDVLCRRIGALWGCRLPAMIGLVLVAVFLLAGVYSMNPFLAVGLLSLCFGFTQFTEGAFAAASTYTGGPHAATAYGVVNTGGNAAGFLAPVIGIMLDHYGWLPTLASG